MQRLGVLHQIVHAHRDHPTGVRHQLRRARPLAAVPGHVLHAAVVAGIQPLLQVAGVLPQLDVGDAQLLESELLCPLAYLQCQGLLSLR